MCRSYFHVTWQVTSCYVDEFILSAVCLAVSEPALQFFSQVRGLFTYSSCTHKSVVWVDGRRICLLFLCTCTVLGCELVLFQMTFWSVFLLMTSQSINQSNQIYIAPYVASESEPRVGGARRSVHVHCKQCQTVLSLKVAWKYWEVQQIYSCMTVSSRLKGR